MDDFARTHLAPLSPGILLALLSTLYGFALGALFGALESGFKPMLRRRANAVLETVYGGDEERREAVVSKGWKYIIRAHIHGGAIGTSALASILLLSLLGVPGLLERLSALAFGAGALIYSIFWLLAGFRAADVGAPKQAKESLWFVAMPGAGLCIAGLLGTILSLLIHLGA